MKIENIEVFILNTPLEKGFAYSQGDVVKRSSVIAKITMDNGIVGWGESLCHGQQPPEMAASIVEYCYKPLLLGKEAADTNPIWESLYNRTRPFGTAGAVVNALSCIDIALYDCLGKQCGQPVYNLLGGKYRSRIMAYATGFHWKDDSKYPESWIEEAQRHLARGFKGLKLKNGHGVEWDIKNINAVRKAIPDDVLLMADFNCAYSFGQAKKLIEGTKEANMYFYEELLVPEDMDGYKTLRSMTSACIASGENMFTKIQFAKWMTNGALDIYQPDLCSAGGFTEMKKILSIAEATNSRVIPHVWGSGIGLAAALQFLAVVPKCPNSIYGDEPLLEFDQSEHPFRTKLIKEQFVLNPDGYVDIPSNPGIGVTVNEDCIKEYGYKISTAKL